MAELTVKFWEWQEAHRLVADWMHMIVLICVLVFVVAVKTVRDIVKALSR